MHRLITLAMPVLMAGGCDDTDFHGHEPAEISECATGDYCGAQSIFEAHCISCHSTGGAAGGLDLETDAHSALVDVESAGNPGVLRVNPGDAEGSLLFRKASATQADDEGGAMPPGSEGLGQGDLDLLRAWIEAGATDMCEGEPDTGHDTGSGS